MMNESNRSFSGKPKAPACLAPAFRQTSWPFNAAAFGLSMRLAGWRHVCLLLLIMAANTGCGSEPSSWGTEESRRSTVTTDRHQATAKRTVVLMAAASTADAVKEVARQFHDATGIEVQVSTGPSNTLAQQILAGAPADVYLSAHPEWARLIERRGEADRVGTLLSNRLVVVVPQSNPAGVQAPDDLKSPRVERIALAGRNVPAGIYSADALQSLNLYGELVSTGKIVRGHDVRTTLTYVVRGEAQAGIVYATDAAMSERVRTVFQFDATHHETIEYTAVLLRQADSKAARRFYRYLWSRAAADVFARCGFSVVNDETDVDEEAVSSGDAIAAKEGKG